MNMFSSSIIIFLLISILFILVYGLFNMMRGGNTNLSQNLMRWRVILQFIAVIAIVIIVFISNI